MFSKILFFILCVFLSLDSRAQSIHDFSIKNYSIEDGLPSNECHDILQDSSGYIWIATDRGLVKYDGYEFKTYGQAEGLNNISCLDICLDRQNNVWIHTWNEGLYKYDSKKDTIYYHELNEKIPEITKNYIGDLLINSDNELIFSVHSFGFVKYMINSDEVEFIKINNEHETYFTYGNEEEILISVDRSDKNFKILPCEEIIYTESKHQSWACQYYLKLGKERIQGMIDEHKSYTTSTNPIAHKFSDGKIFINIYGCSYYFKDNKLEKINSKQLYFLDLIELENGGILSGFRNNGGLKISSSYEKFQNREFKTIISQQSISRILKSKSNDIWCASLENGIYKLSQNKIKALKNETAKIKGLVNFNDCLIYFNDKNSILKRNGSSQYEIIEPKSNNEIYNLTYSTFHNDVIVSGQKSYLLNQDSFPQFILVLNYDGLPFTLRSKNCFPFSKNSVYFIHSRNFIFYENLFEPPLIDSGRDSIVIGSINYMHSLEDDSFLIARNNGICLYEDGTVSEIKNLPPILSGRVVSIHEAHNKYIFGVLGAGLVIWDLKTKPIIIGKSQGLVSNIIEKVVPFGDQQFYICTKNGLSLIHIDPNFEYDIKNYSTFHGLPSNEVNDVALIKDTVFIGTGKGLAFMNMNELDTKIKTTKPQINSFKAAGKPIIKDLFTLHYHQNDVELNYTSLDYKMEGQIPYRYRINESNWTETTNRRANFNALLPGEYSFEVQSRNLNEQWGESAFANFEIKEAWWNSNLFRTALAIFTLLLFYLFYKWRINSLKEKQKVEKELNDLERAALQAQMNPHFIFNCLNSIQNYIYRNDKEQAMEYLAKFSRLIRQTLNASREIKVSLKDEISMLSNYLDLEQMRLKDKFTYDISIDDKIDPQQVLIPALLIQPFIENSIKHGIANLESDGTISVNFEKLSSNKVGVVIRDNGKLASVKQSGIDHKSHGSKITSKRLAFINKSKNKDFKVEPVFTDRGAMVKLEIAY